MYSASPRRCCTCTTTDAPPATSARPGSAHSARIRQAKALEAASISAMKAPSGGGVDVRDRPPGNRRRHRSRRSPRRRRGSPRRPAPWRVRQASGSRHCEPTWKRQAEPRRMRPRRAQQRGRIAARGAELAGQVVARAALRHRQAHDQAEFAGSRSPPVSARIFASSSALSRTKSRTPCSRPGLADGAARLDRVHEVDRRVREHAAAPAPPRRSRRSRNGATPPARTARSTAGSGLHFTAYSTRPGTPATNSPCGRRRRRPDAGNASAPPAARRRRVRRPWAAHPWRQESGGAEGTRPNGRGSWFIVGILAGTLRARKRRVRRQGKDEEPSPALIRRGRRDSAGCCEYFASRQTVQPT